MEERCLHGLDKSTCGICSGLVFKKKERINYSVNSDIVNKYEEIKARFKSYKEIWTEDELFVVYMNFVGQVGNKYDKELIYKTAIELERTRGAVAWAISHIFSEKEYHRGKAVNQFRTEMGLLK